MIANLMDMNINYEVSGSGKDVILLHGWGANIKAMKPIFNGLIQKFKVYSIDLPGFGESDIPNEPWTVDKYADFVQLFIKEMGIVKPILIGHSNGGRISITLASRMELNKIILVDSAGIIPKRTLKYYAKVYSYKTMKKLLKLPILRNYSEEIINSYKGKVGSNDYNNVSGVMQRTFVNLVNTDLRPLMPKVTVPTLLVWGEKDQDTPVSDGKIMESLIKDSGLVVLKNAGHFSYIDKMGEFLVIINEFLKNDVEDSRE